MEKAKADKWLYKKTHTLFSTKSKRNVNVAYVSFTRLIVTVQTISAEQILLIRADILLVDRLNDSNNPINCVNG